ncbi:MAG: hypothetical protein ACP5O0_08680 [Acidimicrobiales bacterium]
MKGDMTPMDPEDWIDHDHALSPGATERLFRQIHKRDRSGSPSSGLEGLLSHLYDDGGDVDIPVDLLDTILRDVRRGRMQRVLGLSRAAFVVRVGALGVILLAIVTMASLSRVHSANTPLNDAQSVSASTEAPTTSTTEAPTTSTTSTTVTAPAATAPSAAPAVSALVQAPAKRKIVNSPVTLPVYQRPSTTTTTTPPLIPMPQAPPTGGNGVYSTGSDCNGSSPVNGVYTSPSTCTTGGPIIVVSAPSSSPSLGSTTNSPVPTSPTSPASPPSGGVATGSPSPTAPSTQPATQGSSSNSPAGGSQG